MDGDKQAGYRFVEYALAIRGRAQLFWSRGLKAKVGVTDKSDEELAIEDQDKASCLGRLESADWHVIRARPGAMAKLLDVAETQGWEGVRAYVDGLKAPGDKYARSYSELRAEVKVRAEEEARKVAEAEAVERGEVPEPRGEPKKPKRRGRLIPAVLSDFDRPGDHQGELGF